MNKITDISSDEDDPYTNSVARLRALKKQRIEIEQCSPKKNIEQQINGKDINGKNMNGIDMNGIDMNGTAMNGKDMNNDEISDEDICIDNEEISNVIQTRSRTVRNTRNTKNTTRATTVSRRTRGRHVPAEPDYDVEFVRHEMPEPRTNDIIALSDDEAEDEFLCMEDEFLCLEDDNYEINIKVHWRSNRIDRLNMRRHDNFKRIFQHYADLEKVSINEVLIMKKDKIVNHTDTPASLKLSIIDILDGGIVNPGMNTLSKDKSNDEDVCTIKVQTANKKQSLTIPLRKDEHFKTLFAKCAEQLGITESNLKLYFDGEQISPTDTPESLDLEEEACVDLRIST